MKRIAVPVIGVMLTLGSLACAGATESGAGVAARVGDRVVEVTDLQDLVERSLADRAVAQAVGEDRAGFQRELLNRLVSDELIGEAARRLDVDVEDSVVDKRVADLEEQSKAQGSTLAQRAAAAKIAPADIRGAIRSGMLSEAILDKLVEDLEITPQQAAALDTYTAAHILVRDRALATRLLAQLRGGADFAALARQHSIDDSSKPQGGQLQETTRGQFVPEFDRAAFSAPLNQVVGPVQSQFGFHLIKVLERTTHTPASLTDEQRRQVLGEASETKFREYISDLADELGVTVNPRFGRWDPEQVAVVEPRDELSSPSAEPTSGATAPPAG